MKWRMVALSPAVCAMLVAVLLPRHAAAPRLPGPVAEPSAAARAREALGLLLRQGKVRLSEPQWPSSPALLKSLCARADTILVGHVVSIVRQDHDPIGTTDAGMATVVSVWVEQYLRSDGAPHQPATIKVFLSGGMDEFGVMNVVEDDPLLNVGDRYILFLASHPADIIGRVEDVTGVEAYADEYLVSEHLYGKVRLVNGVTAVPSDPYQTPEPWTFEADGTTLLGLTEADAIARIQLGIADAIGGPGGTG